MSFIGNLKEMLGMETEEDTEFDTIDNTNDIDTNDEIGKRNKVVNIHATAQLQVILVKPEVFQDTKQIADHLNSKKTVVLNLESTTPDVTRRIIDFLGGVAYANGGNIKPVANNTFIITPYNVGFVGEDLVGELENNGVFL
ncbi:MAG: cell division protein SepF [Oscillospiraceae bacterium]|nr:cell division protein SepF [Oscillospiraceae bacterium]